MRVLLVGYLYGRGGIQGHTHWLARGLQKCGCEVEVLTRSPIGDTQQELRYEVTYPITEYSSKGMFQKVCSAFTHQGSKSFDVAVLAGTGWLAMANLLLNRKIGKRVFFEVMSGKRMGFLDPRTLVHFGFDAVIGQAPEVENRFCKEFKWKKIHSAIPAIPDPLELQTKIGQPKVKLDGGIRAAYFGRLAEHKGVLFLLENWDELSKSISSLDIYGFGPQELELKEKLSSLRLNDSVRMHGEYPSGEKYVRLLQEFHVVLLPTIGEEGAPLVLLESMACGIPFVANGVGGIPSYANEDCGITSGDISEFIPLVKKMADRIMEGKIDACRLQRHYAANFSFDSISNRWYDFLKSIV